MATAAKVLPSEELDMISSDEEEACSELEEMSAELERFHSDEEDSCPMLDELANDVLETAKEAVEHSRGLS